MRNYSAGPKRTNAARLLMTTFLALALIPVFAAVRLPAVIGDHMVLQRNDSAPIWGWSNANEEIVIHTSWDGESYTLRADRNGKWIQPLATPGAGGPYEITIEASNSLVLKDIMIGEVWICSGQSNMAWSADAGIDQAEEAVAQALESQLRFFQVARTTADYPQDDCPGTWAVCSPATMRSFSAVAYFFGRHLSNELEGVPIGLIQSAWGGTAAEVWTPEEVIAANPAFENWEVLNENPHWPRRPAKCWNGMIYPLINFKIAGAIWYQGESNVVNNQVYKTLFPAMIKSWREAWETPFPFYFVQSAPFRYGRPYGGALLREAQLEALKLPRTGMVTVSDIGNFYDIHPRNKLDVGIRLANLALNRTYGKQRLDSGPLYDRHEIEGNEVRIYFKHAEGLASSGGALTGFQVAAEDRIFFDADAVLDGESVVVTSEFVPNPAAVRFAFKNLMDPNLVNGAGLPTSTFRTDDWPILVQQVGIKLQYETVSKAYQVSMNAGEGVSKIRYTINGDHPGLFGLDYRGPFFLEKDCTIRAIAMTDEGPSDLVSEKNVRLTKATFRDVNYAPQNFSNQYTGGGAQALVDGEIGSENHADGRWQGFHNTDLEVVIDFGERIPISSVVLHALKNQDALIFLPKKVAFAVSNDGERYIEVYRKPMFHSQDSSTGIEEFKLQLRRERKSRYLKVTAENVGLVPAWHARKGVKAWMMLDEIEVN
ncbi:MAG: discoidin domain-containing protein [Saprospiraceae bacterium]|nr:discoidin domain-containing protein [Saprospiraceae bacterium]